LLLLSLAAGAETSAFSGVWVETQPDHGAPLRLELTQSGTRLQVRSSFRDYFRDKIVDVATLENGTAVWSVPQACVARFRWPGYNYDNPGVNTYTLSLRNSSDSGGSETVLVYVQETRWNVPCANNHPIGTERVQRILRRL
jgi:hypothetical protein